MAPGREQAPPRPQAPPESRVRAMFDDVVPRYDLLNDLLSLGLDRWWRRATARAAGPWPGERVLDVGCGTGELGRALPGDVRVVGIDVSAGMLAAARSAADGRTALVQGSVFRLPFAPGTFDAAVSGFVLRNLDDLEGAFSEIARVVRPGGRIALVDITRPPWPALGRAFDLYFGTMAPALGTLVGRRSAYRYLARSVAHLPPGPELCRLLERAGFAGARARPLTGGMVTLFTARRPAKERPAR